MDAQCLVWSGRALHLRLGTEAEEVRRGQLRGSALQIRRQVSKVAGVEFHVRFEWTRAIVDLYDVNDTHPPVQGQIINHHLPPKTAQPSAARLC